MHAKAVAQKYLSFYLSFRSSAIITVLLGFLVFMAFGQPRFFAGSIIESLLYFGAELGLMTLGVTVLMIAGEFDLSVGSVFALDGFVLAWLFQNGVDLYLAIALVLLLGVSVGALNGLVVTKTRIPSFIATLGLMMWWRGITYVESQGVQLVFRPLEKYPILTSMLAGKVDLGTWGIPASFIWFIGATLILWLLLNRTGFGNWVYTVGDNREAARERGIRVDRVKLACYVLVGFMVAFAAILQTSRLNTAYAYAGEEYELQAIAAAVIGGTSLFGGVGTVVGTFFGMVFLRSLDTAILLFRAPAFWFQAFTGVAIIIGVTLNHIIERRRTR